jgi:hypothetical protein
MRYEGSRLTYSPTDLIRYLTSPFASWMDRYHLENPGAVVPDKQTEQQNTGGNLSAGGLRRGGTLTVFSLDGRVDSRWEGRPGRHWLPLTLGHPWGQDFVQGVRVGVK